MKKALILCLFCVYLFSCKQKSPYIEFHSYQELSEYDFMRNGWFPMILGDDVFGIRETYDVYQNRAFGKFEFKNRACYDSVFQASAVITKDSVLDRIHKIERPEYPQWFISPGELTSNRFLLAEKARFYLFMDRNSNVIYFIK